METGSILLIELLHLCDVVKAVIVVTEMLVPAGCASVFGCSEHEIGLDHMISHFGEKSFQDALVDGRKYVCG